MRVVLGAVPAVVRASRRCARICKRCPFGQTDRRSRQTFNRSEDMDEGTVHWFQVVSVHRSRSARTCFFVGFRGRWFPKAALTDVRRETKS